MSPKMIITTYWYYWGPNKCTSVYGINLSLNTCPFLWPVPWMEMDVVDEEDGEEHSEMNEDLESGLE